MLFFLASSTKLYADEQFKPDRSAALPYYNRANRYLNQGRYSEAERDLLEAIKLYPDEADFHTNLGIAYRKQDRYVDAEREFKIAIAYNRDDWENWSNLANAYLKQNLLEKTIATFEEALKHKPPAKEVEAIKQDIIDIKKVLASQDKATAPKKATASAPSKKPSRKNSGAINQPHQQATEASPSDTVSLPVQTTQPSSPKQTEWGYDESKANK
ncbi:MAG TPA: tetratricopeptide repeat protein [Oculatellaceae cyanobacterium]